MVVAIVQLLSHVQLFVTLGTIACQVPLSSTISWSLLKLVSTESVMLSNHLILCSPLVLLLSIFSNKHRTLFKQAGSSHQLAKILELQLQ